MFRTNKTYNIRTFCIFPENKFLTTAMGLLFVLIVLPNIGATITPLESYPVDRCFKKYLELKLHKLKLNRKIFSIPGLFIDIFILFIYTINI